MTVFIVAMTFAVQAEVYRWTDENGNTHYSDKPHAQSEPLQLDSPQRGGIGISPEQQARQARMLESFERQRQRQQEQVDSERRAQSKREQECTRLQRQLKKYEDADYLFIKGEDGRKIRLGKERKVEEEQKLRQLIADHC